MGTTFWFSLLLVFAAGRLLCGQTSPAKSPPGLGLCPEVAVNLIPGLNANIAARGLPHVEVRRCSSPNGVNALQVVAWKAGAKAPSIVEDAHRFSVGQVLMNGNVFVITLPGGYDVVQVIRYTHGEPKIAFSESTHADIGIASDGRRVTVTLSAIPGFKKTVKEFPVDESELSAK